MRDPLDFSGRTVLVVGGSSGIGNGIARALAARIARNPGQTLRWSKRLLREGQHQRLESLLELSAALQVLAHKSPAHAEAVDAFIEKREPRFGDA